MTNQRISLRPSRIRTRLLGRSSSGAILLMSVFIGLSGCQRLMPRSVSPEPVHRLQMANTEAALLQAPNIVDAFYQLPYDVALRPGQKAKYDHAAGLPVMFIDGHRTFVKGFQLSGEGELNTLVIKSHFSQNSSGGILGLKHKEPGVVLFPSVLLLSDQFQPLADIKRPEFSYAPESLLKSGRSALSKGMTVSISVPDVAQRATYMVLYVSPENRMGSFRYCKGGTGLVYFNNNNLPRYDGVACEAVPLGMEGRVEVMVQ